MIGISASYDKVRRLSAKVAEAIDEQFDKGTYNAVKYNTMVYNTILLVRLSYHQAHSISHDSAKGDL